MITESQHVLSFDHADPELKKYHVIRHGSMVLFLDQPNGKLMMRFNPHDNTVFVCDPAAIPLSALFGTKRFLVGATRKHADKVQNAQRFPRDLTFTLSDNKSVIANSQLIDGMAEKLTQLLIDLSGFTPDKISEYESSGDAYCRYNKISETEKNGTFTYYIVASNPNAPNEIAGAMTADVIVSETGMDIYLRDELMVPPFDHAQLFDMTRECIHGILKKYPLTTANIFIRAAAGKEENYIKAGCSATDESPFVIHGPPTELAKELDRHVKTQCKAEYLASLSSQSSVTGPAATEQTLFQSYGQSASAATGVAEEPKGTSYVLRNK